MSNYLDTILEDKRQEVVKLPTPVRLKQALQAKTLSVIAEIKRCSPSKGVLNGGIDPALFAKKYVAGGAAAVSVLTDSVHFGGSLHDLRVVIDACPGTPVLRKDFIIDEKQLYETARIGAHAVLLIAAALNERLAAFVQLAKSYGLETLVEVHTLEELMLAQDAGAEIIGVNHRNLVTFEVSLELSAALSSHFIPGVVRVAESGIFTAVEAKQMRQAGYNAILVGEALVTASDPKTLIREFCHAH
jgi:indole-3-glycerol phosphate synthase